MGTLITEVPSAGSERDLACVASPPPLCWSFFKGSAGRPATGSSTGLPSPHIMTSHICMRTGRCVGAGGDGFSRDAVTKLRARPVGCALARAEPRRCHSRPAPKSEPVEDKAPVISRRTLDTCFRLPIRMRKALDPGRGDEHW
jgi:hypothetical protein